MAAGRVDAVTRSRRRAAAARAAVAIVFAAGCGIPVGPPTALPQEGHEDLLRGTTTTTTVVAAAESSVIRLFFIGNDDKLETIERNYAEDVKINDVLKDLEQPPQAEEQPASEEVGLLRSLVPAGLDATLLEENPTDAARGVRIIQVAPEGSLRQLLEDSPVLGYLIVSQVLCTFFKVSPEGTAGVQMEDDQGTIQLADNASQLINGPADEEDFGGCQTGTEERLALLEAGAESTTTEETSADDDS